MTLKVTKKTVSLPRQASQSGASGTNAPAQADRALVDAFVPAAAMAARFEVVADLPPEIISLGPTKKTVAARLSIPLAALSAPGLSGEQVVSSLSSITLSEPWAAPGKGQTKFEIAGNRLQLTLSEGVNQAAWKVMPPVFLLKTAEGDLSLLEVRTPQVKIDLTEELLRTTRNAIYSEEVQLEHDARTLSENRFLMANLDVLFGGKPELEKLDALMSQTAALETRVAAKEDALLRLRARERRILKGEEQYTYLTESKQPLWS
jgi:hypothetical protein